MRRKITAIAGIFGSLCVLYFVWPTPYLVSSVRGQFVRVNRFTGIMQFSSDRGWQTSEERESVQRREQQEREKQIQVSENVARQDSLRLNAPNPLETMNVLTIENPTKWQYSIENIDKPVSVDYYRESVKPDNLMYHEEVEGWWTLEPGSKTEIRLDAHWDGGVLRVLQALPKGETFIQHVVVGINAAMCDDDFHLFKPVASVVFNREFKQR